MTQAHHCAISVWWGESAVELLGGHVLRQAPRAKRGTTLIPASLVRDDPAVRLIRDTVRRLGAHMRVVTPRPLLSAAVDIVNGGSKWRELQLEVGNVRIDSRVLQGHRIGLVPISLDHRQGPFPLDLASRFLHPIDRARFVVSPDRARLAADVAGGARPDWWIITTLVGRDRLWLATTDIIAAELWSLALTERFYDPSVESTGPWEDSTVQRATELELGVRIPAEMWLEIAEAGEVPDDIAEILSTGCRRLGMRSQIG